MNKKSVLIVSSKNDSRLNAFIPAYRRGCQGLVLDSDDGQRDFSWDFEKALTWASRDQQ